MFVPLNAWSGEKAAGPLPESCMVIVVTRTGDLMSGPVKSFTWTWDPGLKIYDIVGWQIHGATSKDEVEAERKNVCMPSLLLLQQVLPHIEAIDVSKMHARTRAPIDTLVISIQDMLQEEGIQ